MRLLRLIQTADPAAGGPIEGIRKVTPHLKALGVQAELATLDAPESTFLQQLPLPAHGLGDGRGGFSRSKLLEPWLRGNAHRFDAAIIHGLWQYHGWAARKVLTGIGLPYFVFPHGMLDPWFKRAYPLKHLKKQAYWLLSERALIQNARSVLFTAEAERRLAQGTFWPYQARENVVLYGTDGPSESELASAPETFLQAHPFLRDRPFLLFLSRIHEKKGIDLLLSAWAAESSPLGTRRLVIAGPCADPAFLEQLKQQARSLGLLGETDTSGEVVFLPMLRGTLKWGAFAASEAFILPSHQENFGIAVAEALACGSPTLISDQVNIHAEITGDGAGFSAPDTVEGTRSLLQQWAALSHDDRAAMRSRARACFLQHFEISHAAAQQAALLKDLLAV